MYCEQCGHEINPRKSLCAVCSQHAEKTSGILNLMPYGNKVGFIDDQTKSWIVSPVFDEVHYNPVAHTFLATNTEGAFTISEHYENSMATAFDANMNPRRMTRSGAFSS